MQDESGGEAVADPGDELRDEGPQEPGEGAVDETVTADVSQPSGTDTPSLKSSLTPGQPASTTSKVMVVVFATVLIVGGIYVATPDDLTTPLALERPGFDQEVNVNMDLGYESPFLSPGINKPEIRDLDGVKFAAAAPVIGVSVNGKHRAYPLVTLLGSFTPKGESGAVVNDQLGGKLVTITNDGDAGLVRVLTLSSGSKRKTIGLWLMGMADGGGMKLSFDKENAFRQDAKSIPGLSDHAFEKKTLEEWRTAHPKSDVYVAEFVTPDLQMEATLDLMTPREREEADRVIAERNRKRKILSPNRKRRRRKTETGAAAASSSEPSVPSSRSTEGEKPNETSAKAQSDKE